MSQHAETIEAVSKSLVHTDEKAREALNRIHADYDLDPLNTLVSLDIAQECERYLQGARSLSLQSRQRAEKIAQFLMNVENKCKSQCAMLNELSIPVSEFRLIERTWAGFWPFVTLISTTYILAANHARIVQSTIDSAVNGTHQDRRLYYEAFRGLRARGEAGGGQKVVVFINDSVRRPERRVDVEVVPLAEGEEL